MKAKRIMASFVAALLLAVTAQAQNAMDVAIDNFVNSKSVTSALTSNNYKADENDTAGITAVYKELRYTLDKDNSQFKKLLEAFRDNMPQGYSSYSKKAGTKATAMREVYYGAYLENTILFGSAESHNYLMVLMRDRQHPKWRTCYAVVWYDNEKNSSDYDCGVYVIYSLDPQKSKSKRGKVRYELNSLGERMTSLSKQLEELDFPEIGLQNSVVASPKEVKTSEDFLSQFGTLRSMYLFAVAHHKSASYKSAIVNSMLSLCRESGQLLTSSEKDACAKALKAMRNVDDDTYQSSLIGIAIESLK